MADPIKLTQDLQVNAQIGAISLAPRGVIDADTVWTERFYTTRDSLTITQEAGDVTNINVDQKNTPVATKQGTGTFSITFTVPDVREDLLDYIFDTSTPAFAPSGYSSKGVSTDPKKVVTMMRIDFGNENSFIATNVELTAVFTKESDGALSLSCTASVLAGGGVGQEPSELILWSKS